MNDKNMTVRLVLVDTDLKNLKKLLASRELCPHLTDYLKDIIALHKGGIRKINIPSTHDNVGVIILGSSSLEETHLHMHDELHVFFDEQTVIVKWNIRGENGMCVPPGELSSLEIKKVLVKGKEVTIILSSPKMDYSMPVDFEIYKDKTTVLVIPHPLNQRPSL